MKLKLTLDRGGEASSDIVVTLEPGTLVGDVAGAIAAGDPQSSAGRGTTGRTLRLHRESGRRLIDPALPVLDSGLASGATVSLALASDAVDLEAKRSVAGTLTLLTGPGAPKDVPLAAGSNTIGRDPSNRVALIDPLVSKFHARVNVGEAVEILDLGSANGTLVNGAQITRAVILPNDVVALGDTSFRVTGHAQQAGVEDAGAIAFNRSPRVDPVYVGPTLKAPDLPTRKRASHVPFLALLAPILMGVVLYFVLPNSLTFVFLLLSPLLMIGSFLDNLFHDRREHKRDIKEFDESLAALGAEVDVEKEREIALRDAESPSVAVVIETIGARDRLLWTRRPEHEAFLSVRLGVGRLPSRLEVELPSDRKGVPRLWKDLLAISERAATVDPVPAVENLRVAGNLGVGGYPDVARACARGLVLQLVGLHSPAEVAIAAVASTDSAGEWDWLKWLPHLHSDQSPLGAAPHMGSDAGSVSQVVAAIEELIETRRPAQQGARAEAALPTLVVLVEDDAPVERARLIQLAEAGPASGVHLIWVASSVNRLPAACRTFLEVKPTAEETVVGLVKSGQSVQPVAVEAVDLAEALTAARQLSPVFDAGAKADDASDLPRSVSLLSLVGAEIATDASEVVSRWRQTGSILTGPLADGAAGRIRSSLRTIVGQGATERFAIDLRLDGPHALVGGTTGSGKSEFLQSWLIGMASTYSPQRVTFLLIDYKGGAAFAECVDLPHTVGLVTDLSQHLVRRALTSLRAEITFREHLLNRKRAKDLIELERAGDPEAPPSLIIIVDEFAALAKEVPEFVDGVVDVAQRGRSLGLHLVLATQRPAGVIKENLRANTNLRIALRMADEADSVDVLGTPDSAYVDPSTPGRASAKTGPGRVRPFQTGFAGGWTSGEPEPGILDIQDLRFGPSVPWVIPTDPARDKRLAELSSGPTDIARVTDTVRLAVAQAEIPVPRKPWLPTLAEVCDISKLPTRRTDEELVFGVLDDPATQTQPVAAFRPDRDGNMAIIGTGGSGKTTALRALAAASALTLRGGPIELYGLDFAGGGLSMLESLPNVGAIVGAEDDERIGRLFRRLRSIVEERSATFAAARASTIVEYRRLAKKPELPRIIVLLDGIGAFRDAYESSLATPYYDWLLQLATDGRQVGIHLVLTGDRAGAIPTSLSASIQRRLVLRLADRDDYGVLGVASDVLSPTSPPGRGVIDDLEVQVAVRGGDPNVAVQSRAFDDLAAAMVTGGVVPAPEIERVPPIVMLDELSPAAEASTFGLAEATLESIGFEATGAFVIAGPPGSGRSTALATVATAFRRSHPKSDLVLFSSRNSRLSASPLWTSVAVDEAATAALAERVEKKLGERGGKPVGIFLEYVDELEHEGAARQIEDLVRAALKSGTALVVGESETSTWSRAYSIGGPLRSARRGLILQPDPGDTDMLLNTESGRIRRASFPPGRGLFVNSGTVTRVQVAMTESDS